MKSILAMAAGRASPAVAKLPQRAAHQAARASRPAPSSIQPGAKQSASPRAPAPTAHAPHPPDPEFRAWLEELL